MALLGSSSTDEQRKAGRQTERRVSGSLYGRTATEITGPLQPASHQVRYRKVLSRRQHAQVLLFGWLHVALALALAVYLLLPGHLPHVHGHNAVYTIGAIVGLAVMVLLQLIAGLRTWILTHHAARARDPIPMRAEQGLKVAVLTTIVPGKEPLELVFTTLRAMKRIRHDGVLDVWLLDEGDDPEVNRRCKEIGVRHFSRRGIEAWNQPTGAYKARTKHGNHNAWRSQHELSYDVVAQMDPDHVPFPNFLERTLGYFADPDTAFVVAPQVYGNVNESFVARGAAELAYVFHGVIQRGGNGHEAPLLIGTNHLYRPRAFHQIGGYQDSIIEDHLTSMVIYTTVNPDTGGNWKGVYTPDVVALGEGPATYSDFFSQQKRWAYGIWEILRQHSPRLFPAMRTKHQRLSFLALQCHYPATAIAWVGGVFLSVLYLVGGVTVTRLPVTVWGGLFAGNVLMGVFFNAYLRRFNLVEHERRSWGLAGMALELVTAPIYVMAAAAQLVGRPLVYVVTPKGAAASFDNIWTFRSHLAWAAVAAAAMIGGLALHHGYPALYIWAALTAAISLAPVAHVYSGNLGRLLPRLKAALPGLTAVPQQRRIGEELVARGMLSTLQLRRLLDLQASVDTPWQRLGDLVVLEGLVTTEQVAQAASSLGRHQIQPPVAANVPPEAASRVIRTSSRHSWPTEASPTETSPTRTSGVATPRPGAPVGRHATTVS
jgi:cellulose synthase (UDP-forming)